jgi:hypothetical protein
MRKVIERWKVYNFILYKGHINVTVKGNWNFSRQKEELLNITM